ncbi:hypothetical protein NDU88_011408 [Pleurodeles waltl]|uniref:Uncharacterized protein n=1 Tax=Pleurodeles waltl TaxID=8319 RepID=A0AAV7PYK8_PLEWA|nr:hypothetical protein NDU88_011408 [Pleurodeles waltl]
MDGETPPKSVAISQPLHAADVMPEAHSDLQGLWVVLRAPHTYIGSAPSASAHFANNTPPGARAEASTLLPASRHVINRPAAYTTEAPSCVRTSRAPATSIKRCERALATAQAANEG